MELTERILAVLGKSGMKPVHLASAMGVKPSVITRLLQGTRKGWHTNTLAKFEAVEKRPDLTPATGEANMEQVK